MRRILIPILVIATVGLVYFYVVRQPGQNPNRITVSGNIEVTEVQVSFKISGRVAERLVDEGQTVKAGQVVARLDATDLQQQLAIRQAELQMAKAALADLEAGSRPQEIAVAKATVQAAEAQVRDAESAFNRIARLRDRNLVSPQDFDTAKTRVDVARSQLREAQERLKLSIEGSRKQTIEQARARVEQAKATVELARTQLGYATLASPLSGVVLSKNIEPGEYVVPGTPIITVGDLVNTWLRVYINETDLGRVKLGQRANVTTDTYRGKTYPGTVSFISSEAEFTPKNVQTQKERIKLVYRVKVSVKNPAMELKPGMPADATILLGPEGK
jgi:HlyD family secretion protein